MVLNRQHLLPTITSPFRRTEKLADAERADELVQV
jgi:cation:H+ antiporter